MHIELDIARKLTTRWHQESERLNALDKEADDDHQAGVAYGLLKAAEELDGLIEALEAYHTT